MRRSREKIIFLVLRIGELWVNLRIVVKKVMIDFVGFYLKESIIGYIVVRFNGVGGIWVYKFLKLS